MRLCRQVEINLISYPVKFLPVFVYKSYRHP